MTRTVAVIFLALSLVGAGCAQGPYMRGRAASEAGDYDTALRELYNAVREKPDDHRAWTEIGVAYYRQERLEKAEEAFGMSNRIRPTPRANFYLGLIFERDGRLDLAIRSYAAAANLEKDRRTKRTIEGRLGVLLDNKLKQEAALAVENEAQLDVSVIPENTIAVINFDGSALPSELGPLALGMAEFTAMDLAKIERLRVVERVKINVILDELRLSQSQYADAATAPRVGKLVGSRNMVLGTVTGTGENSFRIDGAVVNSLEGGISRARAADGNTERFFEAQKRFVFGLIDTLGITLTREERDAIEEVPTENFLAFMAYSEGLGHEKRGLYDEALSSFNNALRHDPGFSQASGMAARVSEAMSYSDAGGHDGIGAHENAVAGSMRDAEDETGLGSAQAGNLANNNFIFDEALYRDYGSNAVDPPWGGPIWPGSGTVLIEGKFDAD